jgi:BlaI family penicillinase repressor
MQLSDAEWRVMDALWRGHPATVREIHQRLEDETDWSYSTVKTMLTRLADKGVVELSKTGHISSFAPLLSRDDARRSALRQLLDRAFDGTVSGLFQHLLGNTRLSARDREELRQLLEKGRSRDSRSKR